MPPTTKIRILPESIVNKIAAGEVVDRPASVLKELIENSLDAGAGTIKVRVEGASGSLISVSDDGCGFSHDDALLSLERHSTSKIKNVGDIEKVETMGFRGEALPSIAAVSRFTLETRRKDDDIGISLEVEGGSVRSSTRKALPYGTTVTVRRLFFNTPVRRKFLRSAPTERSHLIGAFVKPALANPMVRMELKFDEKRIYTLPAVDSRERRIRDIFGGDVMSVMVPVGRRSKDLHIEGYVADPSKMPPGKYQYFFVNRRPVEDRLVHAAMRDGFGRVSAGKRKPDFILYLTLDPSAMDVNVHPTKREVRFSRPSQIMGFIADAVSGSIRTSSAPREAGPESFNISPPRSVSLPTTLPLPDPGAHAVAEPVLKGYEKHPAPAETEAVAVGPYSCFGQVLGGYLVAGCSDSLVLIDQHAAHERVLFEKILARLKDQSGISQNLLWPEELRIQPRDYERILSILPHMGKTGCVLEPFGPSTFRIIALPPEIGPDEVKNFINKLMELFEDLDDACFREPTWWEKPAALIACHGAVKMGERLSPGDIRRLVEDLMSCKDPLHCPHGRPTMVSLYRESIEKLFERR